MIVFRQLICQLLVGFNTRCVHVLKTDLFFRNSRLILEKLKTLLIVVFVLLLKNNYLFILFFWDNLWKIFKMIYFTIVILEYSVLYNSSIHGITLSWNFRKCIWAVEFSKIYLHMLPIFSKFLHLHIFLSSYDLWILGFKVEIKIAYLVEDIAFAILTSENTLIFYTYLSSYLSFCWASRILHVRGHKIFLLLLAHYCCKTGIISVHLTSHTYSFLQAPWEITQ